MQILIISQDITDIINSKDAAEKSNKQLNYVLNAINESVWDWDLITNTIKQNIHWSKFMGDTGHVEEFNFDYMVEHIYPDDREKVLHNLQSSSALVGQ